MPADQTDSVPQPVGQMYEHWRLVETIVKTLERQNATPEEGWGHEHFVSTGAAREMADEVLVALAEAGYSITWQDPNARYIRFEAHEDGTYDITFDPAVPPTTTAWPEVSKGVPERGSNFKKTEAHND